jgi:hypothetical protein
MQHGVQYHVLVCSQNRVVVCPNFMHMTFKMSPMTCQFNIPNEAQFLPWKLSYNILAYKRISKVIVIYFPKFKFAMMDDEKV